ncbi:MAG: TrkA family potassium uptake protein [Defluviitaleaceae bacterium]|nr:TrkA family potassium uptake protein [Defluviitaleaceae bacterium]
MNKSKSFAVLGLGRFGKSLVRSLAESGHEVLACDTNMEAVREMAQYATEAVQLDVTDEMALHSMDLGQFDVVVVTIGTDLTSSVMATLFAKQSGAKLVVAKAYNETQKLILEKVGADRVVLPEWEMGAKIATELSYPNILDYIALSKDYGLMEIAPLPAWINHTILKNNIRAAAGINIMAIKRGDGVIISPKPDEIIHSGDILVTICEKKDLHRLNIYADGKF